MIIMALARKEPSPDLLCMCRLCCRCIRAQAQRLARWRLERRLERQRLERQPRLGLGLGPGWLEPRLRPPPRLGPQAERLRAHLVLQGRQAGWCAPLPKRINLAAIDLSAFCSRLSVTHTMPNTTCGRTDYILRTLLNGTCWIFRCTALHLSKIQAQCSSVQLIL